MYGLINSQVAIQKIDDDLRKARERQRLKDHRTQRSLVLASLLLSRRRDVPKHRRSVPSEG